MFPNCRGDGLDPIRYNINLLINIDKFDPNPMLVNIKKLKPYMFIEDKTLKHVFVKTW